MSALSTFDGARRAGARGQILPLTAIGMVALLAMAALVVDVGYWRYQQRLEQSAADSAAVAGAISLYYPSKPPTCPQGSTPSEITSAAQNAAKALGFADGTASVTVSVTNSPPTPSRNLATPYPCNSAVEVVIRKTQPVFFAGINGKSSTVVSARAVAAIKPDVAAACLSQIGLPGQIPGNPNKKAVGEITTNGGDVDSKHCGVVANGDLSKAAFSNATSSLSFYSAPAPNGTGLAPSLIHQLLQPARDPCFKIPGCAYLQSQPIPYPPGPGSGVDASDGKAINGPAEPGYTVVKNCCGGGTKTTTTFGPGLYYVYGGISGPIAGTGVTIVNVNGAMLIHGSGSGPDISGPLQYDRAYSPTGGVAFYQPPANSNDTTNDGSPATWNGLYYAPSSHWTSNGKPDAFSTLVIGGMDLNGKVATVNPVIAGSAQLSVGQFATHVVLSE